MIPAGSVLVAITGEGKTRGTAALLTTPACTSQHIAAITPGSDVIPEYLWRYLSCFYEWLRFESSGGGSTKAAITCEFLRTVPILLPPADEQLAICNLADEQTSRSGKLIAKLQTMLDRLGEYRLGLIAAAVTGKIDIPTEDPA